MNTYIKICLIAGLCTTTYLILKFINTNLEQESKKKIKPEKAKVVGKNIKQTSSSVEKSGESKKTRSEKKPEENIRTMKIARSRPNFFIGIQVFDKEIHEKVKTFQEMIISKNPTLHSALVPVSTLHITLAVTHLANENEIKTLKLKLEEWTAKNITSLMREPILLSFHGVNTFNDMVAYVSIEKGWDYQKLSELSRAMNDVILSAGFTNDSKRFTPHLTILKLSKDFSLLKCRRDFKQDFGLMKQCTEYFGKQEVKNIQLLSMSEPKDKNGYYKCFHQINISDIDDEIDHSKCCSPIPEPKINNKKRKLD